MTTAPLRGGGIALADSRRANTATRVALGIGVALATLILLQLAFRSSETFPESWNIHLADPVSQVQTWIRDNRADHWLFTGIITPASDALDSALGSIEDFLQGLPWFLLPLVAAGLVARTRRYGSAAFVALCTLYPAAVGLWAETTQTLALITVSVVLAVVVGLPLGIWSAQSRRVERILRPVLDMMQVVPATVYLIPAVMILGIGKVPAVAATFIYALPPMIRLTAHGLREVPPAAVEAADIFGSSRMQSLRKVRIPLAMRSIVTGVNQTIMMALGIVVIAGLVGAQGLGAEVLRTLQIRSPGEGMVAGLAIVAIALVLDRVGRALVTRPDERIALPRVATAGIVAAVVLLAVVGDRAGWAQIPVSWDSRFAQPLDDFIVAVRDSSGWLTRGFNDWFVTHVLIASRDFLTDTLAWPVLVAGTAMIGWAINGWRLALFSAVGVMAAGLVGFWEASIQTLIQVVVCVIVSMAIAIPLGVFVGKRRRLETVLYPFLDALQTIPSLVYTIPFVMIFTVGQVPGLIATVLYAIPPGIRITALGVAEVDNEALEASTTFGATERQTLWRVRIPLALPTIMVAVNQVIMMVMAMIIIIGLVGGGALGFEAVNALTRTQAGTGAEVAVAIVFMAMILDRMTEGIGRAVQPPAAH